MFWRKQKAAIAGFPPLHQALIHERGFTATQPADAWTALAASLGRHNELVRRSKWALPPRTLDVLVPLILEVCSDVGRTGMLTVTADLRGPEALGKTSPSRNLAVRPPVRSAVETWTIDPWLRLHAELRDGSVLDILVVDRARTRRVTKRNPRGKTKVKRKIKQVQIIKVRRRLPKDGTSARPAGPPPRWITVQVREGRRRSVLAAAKIDRLPRSAEEQLDRILTVTTEPFRWTPQTTAGGAR
ncbi:hypothetical protein AB0G04_34970 [Actinoplanes sp. NPDC023801]|uniref:hypothetical protein n=1 Tax=Actinoplanes sp. NPDC023801 TaxID=3154595 RepID=UPI0033C98FE9